MLYVILFFAGAAAAAGALIIWYLPQVAWLRKEQADLRYWRGRLESEATDLRQQAESVASRKLELDDAVALFESRKVQYDALVTENNSLKQDLFNLSVQLRKMNRDHASIRQDQEKMDRRTNELADRYLNENVFWIAEKLTPNNFASCKRQLLNVVQRCRDIGFDVAESKEDALIQDLRKKFEEAVRAEFHRQEQARIKAQIREEEKLAREIERQVQEAQREEAAIHAALERALRETKDEHSAEVEHLKAKLKEAEEKAERAKSRAQTTKSGHVYVLSNIGSFGHGVYKIGMTRRLEPLDRVKELGDASVPFPFDVHMMISCDDAPSLENALHREFHAERVNKVNLRKEYFRIEFESICRIVEQLRGEVDYIADPEAIQYREGLDITEEDYEFVEGVVQSVIDEEGGSLADE